MSIIKLILGVLGAIFAVLIILSLLGWVGTLLWYLFWIGVLGGLAYGGYKLFTKAEARALGGSDPHSGLRPGDVQMSWDEYDKKYLHK